MIELPADEEQEFVIYTKFVDEDLMPHDWSFTAWGEQAKIYMWHTDRIQTA